MRELIPYNDFTLNELNMAIRDARESMKRLAVGSCERSMRSIVVLRNNVREMEEIRNALDT